MQVSRLLKKSAAQGRKREHSGIQVKSGTESNCGGNEFFNSLLVVKIKRKSPAQGQRLQRFTGRIKGTKCQILSTSGLTRRLSDVDAELCLRGDQRSAPVHMRLSEAVSLRYWRVAFARTMLDPGRRLRRAVWAER